MRDVLKGLVFVGLFAIPFIPLIVTDSMFFPFITGKNFTFRAIVEIIFGAWILLSLLDAAYRPRFSWLLSGASVFLIVMFFADLLGEYPLKSFWSNFERMDGYVTLIHFYLYFVVLGSTLRENRKLWMYYLWTTVAAAGFVVFQGLQQHLEGKFRVDSTLGNAAYMAIYTLFHIFFSLYLFVQSKQWWTRGILVLLFSLFTYVLILTSTRGTFLGLVVGLLVMVVYMLIFARAYPTLRKVALGGLIALLLAVGSIYAFKDAAVIQGNPTLSRLANISLDDLDIRFNIWGMALEGVKERPILGWGQGNFNYIFNKEYVPDLYRAEAWYDRAHDIVFDWLVAGGILGLLAYVSMFVALAYYLVWRPFFKKREDEDHLFSVPERAVLTGLIAAYLVHNLVVFDNIVSYIFFGLTLGLIHGRVGRIIPSLDDFEIDPRIVTNIATPVMIVVVGAIVYFVNVPGYLAAHDIIDALTESSVPGRLEKMEKAIDRGSFAYQEIVEQLAQQAMQLASNPNIPPEQKREFVLRAEAELLNLAAEKPGDARIHVYISGFYRSIGSIDRAMEHAEIAHQLSPRKQTILLEQGVIAYQKGDFEAMSNYFKQAFELQESFSTARVFYATSLLYLDKDADISEIITPEYFDSFARNDFALQSVNRFERSDLLIPMFQSRIEAEPQNGQNRASLAFLQYQEGDIEGAIGTLEAGVETIPSFAELGTCYINNLREGNTPDDGCAENGSSAN